MINSILNYLTSEITMDHYGEGTPTKTQMLLSKYNIDADAITALITNRLHVMAQYAKDVILPMLCEERKHATKTGQALLLNARAPLIRDSSLLQPSHEMHLSSVLESFQSLRIIYQLRLKLQDIWSRKTATKNELLEAFSEWCQQAEETGINTLQKFVNHLKTYVPSGNRVSTI